MGIPAEILKQYYKIKLNYRYFGQYITSVKQYKTIITNFIHIFHVDKKTRLANLKIIGTFGSLLLYVLGLLMISVDEGF